MLRTQIAVSLAFAWLGFCVLAIVVSLFLPLPGPLDIDLSSRLQPPIGFGGSIIHPAGTDDLGRDMLVRLIGALKISLLLALGATTLSAIMGTGLGILAAHFGGIVDQIVVAAIDTQASVPFMIVALTITAFLGTDILLFLLILSIFGWERFARLARAMTVSAKSRGYVLAMRTLGFSSSRIYLRHVLPNIISSLLVTATITFPEIILIETSLSFLGVGIQPPTSSLGNMLGFGRSYLLTGWWIAIVPGVTLFFCTLSVSMIGDWARAQISRL